MIRLGVDTGGTFTDVVCYDPDGGVTVVKTPSTPPAFDRGVLTGIDDALDAAGVAPGDVSYLVHGTTVGTNAVLEGTLPDLGLITNEGLRDVLEIGDQTRPDLYDLQTEKPPALIPRHRRHGVPGRLDASGDVVDPLDEDAVRAAVDDLAAEGVDSVVVATLFSHLSGRHEQRIGELIEAHGADLGYALSSAVHPERREYERTITTVLNEAVKRTVDDYLDRLTTGTTERGIDAPLNVMHSGGGVFGVRQATERAIRTVLSGPSAGAVAARTVARAEGFDDAVGIDMGGTSADVSLVRDGSVARTTEGEIADLPLEVPMIDVTTVGEGGGSIVRVDAGGAVRVGPESAGADPGPVCYARGGDRPTLTDANLLLGRLDPDYFLGGELPLAADRAREAFAREVADPLGESVEAAAQAAVDVANAGLAREIRRVTVARGHDPDEFVLVGFGGAGPLQAVAVATEVGMDAAVIPRTPGVFSARGLLVADVRIDESAAYPDAAPDAEALADGFETLEQRLRERATEQGIDAGALRISRRADLRYAGQSYELAVAVPSRELDPAAVDRTVERFHDAHARRYGHALRDEPLEAVTLRATGTVPTPAIEEGGVAGGDADDATKGRREVYFGGRFHDTAILDRGALGQEATVEGPAVVEESGSTTVLPPEASASVSERGALIVRTE